MRLQRAISGAPPWVLCGFRAVFMAVWRGWKLSFFGVGFVGFLWARVLGRFCLSPRFLVVGFAMGFVGFLVWVRGFWALPGWDRGESQTGGA